MQWHKSSDISQIVISLVLRTRAITCDMPLLAIALPYNITCAQRSLCLNNTRANASVLFKNNARPSRARECVILDKPQVQVFILYKTPRIEYLLMNEGIGSNRM